LSASNNTLTNIHYFRVVFPLIVLLLLAIGIYSLFIMLKKYAIFFAYQLFLLINAIILLILGVLIPWLYVFNYSYIGVYFGIFMIITIPPILIINSLLFKYLFKRKVKVI
jgi:hypothetical protein